MSNDFWSYESKDTYRAKQAADWASKAQSDAFSYLAPKQTGLPDEAVSQNPNSIFAPSPLISKQDTQGKDSGGFFKGLEDVGKGIYDVTLKPINRVLEAEHNATARPISKLLLSPFGDYNNVPGIVRLGVETLTDPLTYIGPGEVMKAFQVAKIAPELRLGAPALQALFDSPGSRRLFAHVITQGGLGLAAAGGATAAKELGIPGIVGGIAGVALAGKRLNKLNPEDVSQGIKPSTADDLRTSMETAWSKGRQAGHIDASQAASAERLAKLGTEDDLMQRMYDQTEMLQLKKKIDSGQATDEELNRASELLHKADTLLGKNTFQTSKGSNYTVLPDGRTIRDKAAREEHPGDFGIKPSSDKTVYISGQDANALALPSNTSWRVVDHGDGTISLATRQGEDQPWGISPSQRNIKVDTQPSVGSHPVELNQAEKINGLNAYKEVHFGNDITSIGKSTSKLPPIGGGASGSTQSMQTIIDNLNSSDPKVQQLINATSDIEVKANQQVHQGWTVGARDKLGNFLDSSTYGTNLSNYLKSQGLRLHDTDATAYINEAGRLSNLGAGYSAAMADQVGHLLQKANDSGTLQTSYMKANGTIINDQLIRDQARLADIQNPALKLLNPDGSLSLHTLVNNQSIFTLSPEQQAIVSGLTAPMQLHHGLEHVFGVENQGPLAHVEPLDENGNIRRGHNAVQGFERPQGDLAGSQGYLPYAEAQATRVDQGYHKIADSWLNATLDGMGKTASQLVPSELVDAINSTSNLRKQGHLLTTRIQDAVNNYGTSKESAVKLPEDFLNSPYLDPQIKDIAWAVSQPGMRKPQIQPLLDRLNGILAPVANLSNKQAAIMDEIRSGKGSQFRADYPVEFQGKYYPQDVGEQLNRYNQSVSPTGITKSVIDINNTVRPIMATLDASFMGVQGLVALLSNPMAYLQAMKTLVTNGYGDYENTIRDSGRLASMLNSGVHWAARNDAGEYLFPSAMSKLPVVGRMASNSNTWFTQFGNVLRSELYNSVNWEGMTAEKQLGLARTVNLMTGFSPSNPTNLESAATFAPRFFRSQMGLIADAVTKHDMSGMGAARALSTMIASGTALTYGMNEALGQKTDFNPESPNFLRVRVGGQDVAIFGTWDTLARALTKSVQSGNPLAGAEYLARAKASPVMSKVYDLISGSTLQGNKLKWGSPGDILTSAAKEAKTVLPISASQIAGDVAKDPSQLGNPAFVGGQILQFMGTKATPLSPSENMAIKRDQLAQSQFGKSSWDQLEPFQQQQLHNNNNVDLPPKSDIAKAFAFHRDINTQFQAQQEKLDASMPVGKSWIDEYHNLIRERVGAFGQWAREHPEAAAKITSSAPKDANDAALQGFYKIFDTADKQSWGPDEITQAVSDFQDSITPAQQSYIDRNTGLHDTQRVKDYKAAQKVLRPYWDLGDTVFDRLKSRLPQGDQAASLQDYTDNLISKLQAAGVPDQVIAQRVKSNPVLTEITRATGQLRERYRATHPQAQALLAKWYGYGPTAP